MSTLTTQELSDKIVYLENLVRVTKTLRRKQAYYKVLAHFYDLWMNRMDAPHPYSKNEI